MYLCGVADGVANCGMRELQGSAGVCGHAAGPISVKNAISDGIFEGDECQECHVS